MLLMLAWVWCLMLLMLAVSCGHMLRWGLSVPVSSVSPVLGLLELSSQPVALKYVACNSKSLGAQAGDQLVQKNVCSILQAGVPCVNLIQFCQGWPYGRVCPSGLAKATRRDNKNAGASWQAIGHRESTCCYAELSLSLLPSRCACDGMPRA